MLQSVKRRYNRQNLVAACSALRSIAPFAFFGTLLGLTRDDDIIKGDDDVDLYIDARDRDTASALLRAVGFEIVEGVWPNNTPHFLQATRILGRTKTFVDIYCYENRQESPWIIDRWNFIGRTDNPEHHLCVDKDLVFPLRSKRIFGTEVLIPRRPAKCCRYLYGPTWREKISKQNGGYSVVILDNRPHILSRDSIANKIHLRGVAKALEVERLEGQVVAITAERDAIAVERDQTLAARDALVAQRDHSAIECESMRVERDRLAAERDVLTAERDGAVAERDAIAAERDDARAERDAIAGERDEAAAGREAMTVQRDAALAERDAVRTERDGMTAQRDEAVSAQSRLTIERDQAVAARDGMQQERDHARVERGAMAVQRDQARAERDAMVARCDHAVAERDAMAAQRDHAVAERDAALARPVSTPVEAGRGMGRLFKASNPG